MKNKRRVLDPIEWLSAMIFLFAMVVVRIGDWRECHRCEPRKRLLPFPVVAPHGAKASDLTARNHARAVSSSRS